MAARFDMLLEHWLLRYKVRLQEKKMPATAIGRSLRMLRASALDKKSTLGPKFMLADDLLHPLKPPWILGVVVQKIK